MDDKEIDELYQKAIAAEEAGNLPYACDLFWHLLSKKPDFHAARVGFLRLEIYLAREEEARTSKGFTNWSGPSFRQMKKAIKTDPNAALTMAQSRLRSDGLRSRKYLDLFVDAALAAGHPKAATLTLEMLIPEFFGDDTKLLKKLGGIYREMGLTERALETYLRLVALAPTDLNLKLMKDAVAIHNMYTRPIVTYVMAED